MFQFPSCPPHTYVFSMRYPGIPLGGFPHSDTPGSSLVDSSPRLFAACRVLLRLLAPRHPPCALCSLFAQVTPYSIFLCSSYSVFNVLLTPPTQA